MSSQNDLPSKIDLILHPVRFRILQSLTRETLTTQEIADRLPDVAKSSIYRHLKLLLAGEMVAIVEKRLVNGIQEKVYTLTAVPRLSAEDVLNLSSQEHLHYFTVYLMTLLRGFADYLQTGDPPDLLADKTGYSEAIFFANDEELTQFKEQMQTILQSLAENGAGNGRHKHKFAIISHPIPTTHEE